MNLFLVCVLCCQGQLLRPKGHEGDTREQSQKNFTLADKMFKLSKERIEAIFINV